MSTPTGLLALLLCGALSACATFDPDALAAAARLRRQYVDTGRFVLTAFVRVSQPGKPLRVYIEGDGAAWLSRTEPAPDPTPREALGLALAAEDPAPNVVYLARPCQFTPMAMNPSCGIPYWTSKRFATEVIASMDAAVSRFAALTPGQAVPTSCRFAPWPAISTANSSIGCMACRRCRRRQTRSSLPAASPLFRNCTSAAPRMRSFRQRWRSASSTPPAHAARGH